MRKVFYWSLFPLLIALLLAAFANQPGTALNTSSQQATPTFIPSERLLQPTLPANPMQADKGAVDYWLNCMACHGDRGQGLTDEFRMLYPPEEQTCWQSGCHGERPYENGFTLPTAIPPVVGPEALLHDFTDASVLYAFITSTMPWHKPGSLEPEVYWRLTTYLLRENGYENPYQELGPDNADFVLIGGQGAAVGTEEVAQATAHPTQAAQVGLIENQGHLVGNSALFSLVAVLALLLIVAAVVVWRRRRTD